MGRLDQNALDAANDIDFEGQDLTGVGNFDAENIAGDGTELSRDTDATFYVDEASGDDSNDGASAASAFASYERALEEVARFNDGSAVIIEQIGDYSSDVTIENRHFGDNSVDVRGTGLEIRGGSQTSGQGGTDPSNIETINGDILVHGGSGIQFDRLHLNGRVSAYSSALVKLNLCKLGSDGLIFVRNFGGMIRVNKCELDPQSQDPVVGVQSLAGGVMITNNLTYQNWDPLNNTFLSSIEGFILDGDLFNGKDYDDNEVSRTGHVYPIDGLALAAPTNDLDLRGRDLPGVGNIVDDDGNTVYDYANNWVPQTRFENDSLSVAGNSVSLGDATAVDHSDISNIGADDHHARDHAARHGVGGADELSTALRYEPQAEPSTPNSGVVRWYDQNEDAFKVKFDDGSSVTLAQK